MRIIVVSELPQFLMGGFEMHSQRQIEIWLRLGHEIQVFGKTLPPSSTLAIGGHAIKLHRIGMLQHHGRALRGLSYFFSLARLIRQQESWAEVVYCMGLGEAAATVCMLKAMGLSRLPIVAMPGSAGSLGDVGHIRSVPGHHLIVKLLNRFCDRIVTIAPQMPADLEKLGLSVPQIDIPIGIPIMPRVTRANQHAGPLRFVAVGRLVGQKGFDILLRALALLKTRNDFLVEIVGDGKDRADLEALAAQLGVGQRVCWRGALSPAEVLTALGDADVFLQPSRYEGLSNAALEAMSCGLPVIVTRCGGIDTYIDASRGWTAPIEDPQALAKKISMALETPIAKLRGMGNECRTLVEQEFDIEPVARRYLDLFSRVIDKSREGHRSNAA